MMTCSVRRAVANNIDAANENLHRGEKIKPQIPNNRINDILISIAQDSSFHPFKDYVESYIWDGNDHLGELFKTLEFQNDFKKYESFYLTVFKKFFVGIVAKVYIPGAKNFVFVIQGKQGIGKSRWCDTLLSVPKGCYSEGSIDPEKPDSQAHHMDKVLWHIAEFDAVTGKRDVAALKAYVDKNEVTFRRPYDKYAKTAKSILSFIASVNTTDFLKDPTGSRRYLVFPLDKLNANHSLNLQQVYAQAKHLLDNRYECFLTKAEESILESINRNFSAETSADNIIEHIGTGGKNDWYSVTELISKISDSLYMPILKNTNTSILRNKLEQLGYLSKTNGKSAKKFNVKIRPHQNESSFNSLSDPDSKPVEPNLTQVTQILVPQKEPGARVTFSKNLVSLSNKGDI